MTALTLISDADLRWQLAGPEGVPITDPDERLPVLYAAGRIEPYGAVWRWQVRIPSQLTRDQREVIRDDMAYARAEDI